MVTADDYYPFGLLERSGNPETSGQLPGRSYNIALAGNQYKYSGKELDEEGGLDWYYFGARYYDPAIGRWLAVDPLTHVYPSCSPYTYTLNSPLKYKDPNGEFVITLTAAGILTADFIVSASSIVFSAFLTVELVNTASNGDVYKDQRKSTGNVDYGSQKKKRKVKNSSTDAQRKDRYAKSMKQQPTPSPDPSNGMNDNDPSNPRFLNIGKSNAVTLMIQQLMADGYTYFEALKKVSEDQAKRQEQAQKEKKEKEKEKKGDETKIEPEP